MIASHVIESDLLCACPCGHISPETGFWIFDYVVSFFFGHPLYTRYLWHKMSLFLVMFSITATVGGVFRTWPNANIPLQLQPAQSKLTCLYDHCWRIFVELREDLHSFGLRQPSEMAASKNTERREKPLFTVQKSVVLTGNSSGYHIEDFLGLKSGQVHKTGHRKDCGKLC